MTQKIKVPSGFIAGLAKAVLESDSNVDKGFWKMAEYSGGNILEILKDVLKNHPEQGVSSFYIFELEKIEQGKFHDVSE